MDQGRGGGEGGDTWEWILTILKYKNERYKQLELKNWAEKRAFFAILAWPQREI